MQFTFVSFMSGNSKASGRFYAMIELAEAGKYKTFRCSVKPDLVEDCKKFTEGDTVEIDVELSAGFDGNPRVTVTDIR